MRFLQCAAVFGFMLAVAGCQSGDGIAALDLGLGKKRSEPAVPEGAVRESELRAFCPRVVLREGTSIFRSYEKNGQDDPTKLVYQASISDVTRSCVYQPGTIVVTVAVAGKVVPGPVSTGGTVNMPIRIVALRGEEVIYSQLFNHQVAVDRSTGAAQFIFTDPGVTVPADPAIRIFAGYDEGPAPKKKASADD